MDEEPETDEGTVTLVNRKDNPDGSMEESETRTGLWAWKEKTEDGGERLIPLREMCGSTMWTLGMSRGTRF